MFFYDKTAHISPAVEAANPRLPIFASTSTISVPNVDPKKTDETAHSRDICSWGGDMVINQWAAPGRDNPRRQPLFSAVAPQ